jgi:hypothetical protein
MDIRHLGIRDFDAPGASAEYRFRAARLRWWGEHLEARIVFSFVPVVLTVVAFALSLDGMVLYAVGFIAGFYTFGAAGLWLLVPREVENFRTGAEGEVATADALKSLAADGWRIVHDRALTKTNVDHVLVGPGGIYAIETKRWQGTLNVDEEGLTRNGRPESNVGRNCRSAARELSAYIKGETGKSPWIQGVVVLWGDFEPGIADRNRVTYLSGDQVVDWVRSRPGSLSGSEIDSYESLVASMPAGIELSLAT